MAYQYRNRRLNFQTTYNHSEYQAANIGRQLNSEKAQKAAEKEAKLIKASYDLANQIHEASKGTVNLYRYDSKTQIDKLTGKIKTSKQAQVLGDGLRLSDSKFLPINQSNNRRKLTNLFGLYQQIIDSKEDQYVLCNDNKRKAIPVGGDTDRVFGYAVFSVSKKETVDALDGNIVPPVSMLNKISKALALQGITFRLEFARLEIVLRLDPDGRVYAHPHWNVIYSLVGVNNADDRRVFRATINEFTYDKKRKQKAYWHDAGVIFSAEGVIRYVNKPFRSRDEIQENHNCIGRQESNRFRQLVHKPDTKLDEHQARVESEYRATLEDDENTTNTHIYAGEEVLVADLNDSDLMLYYNAVTSHKAEFKGKDFSAFCTWLKTNGISVKTQENQSTGVLEYVPVSTKGNSKKKKKKKQTGNGPVNYIVGESAPHPNDEGTHTTSTLMITGFDETKDLSFARKRIDEARAAALKNNPNLKLPPLDDIWLTPEEKAARRAEEEAARQKEEQEAKEKEQAANRKHRRAANQKANGGKTRKHDDVTDTSDDDADTIYMFSFMPQFRNPTPFLSVNHHSYASLIQSSRSVISPESLWIMMITSLPPPMITEPETPLLTRHVDRRIKNHGKSRQRNEPRKVNGSSQLLLETSALTVEVIYVIT